METKKIVTYSLLAHIRNNGTLIRDLLDVFVPLVKNSLATMNARGVFSGESIMEIKNEVYTIYALDMPLPVLNSILDKIKKEINTEDLTKFVVHKDQSFDLSSYIFDDFDAEIARKKKEIETIEKLFKEFAKANNFQPEDAKSVFDFIELNKLTIGKYLHHQTPTRDVRNYTLEAQFVDFFRSSHQIYDLIKDIYLGSIISSYVEFQPGSIKTNVELLLDTNFIIGLIDLNTPESTHTCNKLLEVAFQQGYSFSILADTILETRNLLFNKANGFNQAFLVKKINREDIYNACDRLGYKKADLERIADSLESVLNVKNISIVHDTTKYKNKAKFSEEYEAFKHIRGVDLSALHDATAMYYVKTKRGDKRIKRFEDVNCWFVNNNVNTTDTFGKFFKINGHQPEIIKADDLLNVLWLTNPNGMDVSNNDLASIGLTTLISCTLNSNLPKSTIIRELDANIQKYAKDKLEDIEFHRIAIRIANSKSSEIAELNSLAEVDSEKFVARLEHVSNEQKKIEESKVQKLDEMIQELQNTTLRMNEVRSKFQNKSRGIEKTQIDLQNDIKSKELEISQNNIELEKERKKRLDTENKLRAHKREDWYNGQIRSWRKKGIVNAIIGALVLFLTPLLFLLMQNNFSFSVITEKTGLLQKNELINGIITLVGCVFTGVLIKRAVDKYTESNMKAYKDLLANKIPTEFQELKSLD